MKVTENTSMGNHRSLILYRVLLIDGDELPPLLPPEEGRLPLDRMDGELPPDERDGLGR